MTLTKMISDWGTILDERIYFVARQLQKISSNFANFSPVPSHTITMLSPKLLLKAVSIVLLGFLPIAIASSEVRSEVIAQQSDYQSQNIDQLIEQLKMDNDSVDAILKLGKIGEPAIPKLLPLLRDNKTNAQVYALWTLGNMGKSAQSAIPHLILLLKDQHGGVRFTAAEALGKMGESAKVSIPHLIPLLKDQNGGARLNAAEALGKMGESARVAIPYLIPLLQEQNEKIRSRAAESLRKLGYKP